MLFGMGRVDASGRVAGRAILRALGWRPAERLTMGLVAGSVVVRPDPAGVFALTAKSSVTLPARVRLRCGVHPGEQVLLAVPPGRHVLLVHPMPVLDGLLAEHHAALLGGDHT